MQAGMHIIKKEATQTRPAEVPQTVLVEGSNLPHCERPVDEQVHDDAIYSQSVRASKAEE